MEDPTAGKNRRDERLKAFLLKKGVKDFSIERRVDREFLNEDYLRIIARNKESGKEILELLIEEFPYFHDLVIMNWGHYDVIEFYKILLVTSISECTFYVLFDLSKWNYPFNFEEYWVEFSRVWGLGEYTINVSVVESPEKKYYEIGFLISRIEKDLLKEIISHQTIILSYHKEAIKRLSDIYNSNLISFSFNFPNELKISCEQYLLYFATFLQDLGINATSNLKEEAGKVLFSVTPIDDTEALDKIREALAVYLNLPSSPIVYDESFAAMRLQQQIENLQHSQRMAVRELQFNEKLLIAQSDTLREKNLTISQQQSVIEQKDKIIEKLASQSIMMDSVENKEELEKICEGLEVGESKFIKEQIGIKFNPAKIIKTMVKNTLGKGEEIIELGLNKKD